MEFNKKGGLVWYQIIGLAISVILLIMGIFWITTFFEDTYNAEVMECNFFMKNIDGKSAYFGSGFDKIQFTLLETISNICPSKDVVVSNKDFSEAANLVSSCYREGGLGTDFFGANIQNENICIFCGFIKSDEEISDFGSKFIKSISKEKYSYLKDNDTELISLNKDLLFDENFLPKSLEKESQLMVFYFAYKPSFEALPDNDFVDTVGNTISTGVSTFVGEHVSTTLSYLMSESNVIGYSGVGMKVWPKSNEDFETEREVNFYGKTSQDFLNCDRIVIPKKNYD